MSWFCEYLQLMCFLKMLNFIIFCRNRKFSYFATELSPAELKDLRAIIFMDQDYDLLSIGRHCSIKDCNQLDFLPFTCSDCHATFWYDCKARFLEYYHYRVLLITVTNTKDVYCCNASNFS